MYSDFFFLFDCVVLAVLCHAVSSLRRAGSFIAGQGLASCGGSLLSCSRACKILVPQQGIEPMSPALQGRFLITGPPGSPI